MSLIGQTVEVLSSGNWEEPFYHEPRL